MLILFLLIITVDLNCPIVFFLPLLCIWVEDVRVFLFIFYTFSPPSTHTEAVT